MLRLCSCGFATADPDWFEGHLFEHPGHQERTRLPAADVARKPGACAAIFVWCLPEAASYAPVLS